MNGESGSLFKILRALWFPMSVNATALAAAGVLVFHLATWLFCWMAGSGGMAASATEGFLPASRSMLTEWTWPGYATDTDRSGEVVHASLAGENPSAADRAKADADIALVRAVHAEWIATRTREVLDAGGADAEARRKELNGLATALGRYRWIFAGQLVLFFALLATFGVAICRILALRIARDEYCTLAGAWGFAWRVRLTGLLFPVAVALPVGVLAGLNLLAGTMAQIPYLGWLLGVLVLPLVLVSAVLIVLIGLGALVSIGLVPAAIAIERKGTYDSLGKAYSYIFARPLPLILYLALLWVFLAVFHKVFVEHALVERTAGSTMLLFWSNDTFEAISGGRTDEVEGFAWFCAWLWRLVLRVFRLLVWGALISYALGAFTSMFLVFRRDVDGLDEADLAQDPAG